MAIEHKVKIPIQPIIDLRTEQAEAKLRSLDQRLHRQIGGEQPGQPGTSSARAIQTMQSRFGSDFSFLQHRRAINTMIRQEHQTVRDLTEQYERLKNTKTADGKQQADAIKKQIADHRLLAQAMRTVQISGETREGGVIGAGPGGNVHQSLIFNRTVLNQLAGRGMGGRFSSMLANNMGMLKLGVAGAALGWGFNKLTNMGEGFEPIELGYENVRRRTGGTQSLLEGFQWSGGARGQITDRLLRLGFTHRDTVGMAQAFGLPANPAETQRAIVSQADYARRLGFGDNPEVISGLGRHVSMMGMPVGKQQDFWRQMFGVAQIGTRFGVDAQDTTKGVITLLTKIADHTGLLTPERISAAMYISMRTIAAGRIFQGEAGLQRFGSMMDAFKNPKSIQAQAMRNNILMQSFGGKIPSGKELGLDDDRAAAFDQLVPTQKLAFIGQNMDSLKGGEVANKYFAGLDRAIPKNLQTLYLQHELGLNESQLVERMVGTKGLHDKPSSSMLGNLAGIYDKEGLADQSIVRRLLRAGKFEEQLTDPTHQIERNLAKSRSREEMTGKAGSDLTLTIREMANEFMNAIVEWLSTHGFSLLGALKKMVGQSPTSASSSDMGQRLFGGGGSNLDSQNP